ncbi:MAG: hypothetical protein ACOX02_03555 [Acholeplasmatales bacterium]
MKKIIKLVIVLFIGFLIFLTGQTVAEHINVRQKVRNFTKLGVLQNDISTDKIKFYKVSRETYYPNEYYRDAFYNNSLVDPGAEGDILLTQQAPYPTLPGIYEFVSFYFGGHAAYVGSDNIIYDIAGYPSAGETFLGVYFNGGKSTIVSDNYNYWLDSTYNKETEANYKYFGGYYRKEFFGIRVKGVTKEEVAEVTKFMKHLDEIKAQYNFQYIFNKKDRYYCTDMMERAYNSITNSDGKSKYNLNNDGVAVTVNDMLLSKDVYISFYVRTDKNNVKHIYYIG